MLLINFKIYPQAIGPQALELTQKLAKTARDFPHITVGFAPPILELAKVTNNIDAPIWAQHLDPVGTGKFTGHLSPANAKAAGSYGTFLNHSEHQLNKEEILKTLELAKEVKLKVLVFADSPQKVAEFKDLSPDLIAYEPPELIGGDVSVTSAKPEVIKQAVETAGDVPLLIGAGVHEKADISTAISLGVAGAVVSSAVVTVPNPEEILTNLLAGFKV